MAAPMENSKFGPQDGPRFEGRHYFSSKIL